MAWDFLGSSLASASTSVKFKFLFTPSQHLPSRFLSGSPGLLGDLLLLGDGAHGLKFFGHRLRARCALCFQTPASWRLDLRSWRWRASSFFLGALSRRSCISVFSLSTAEVETGDGTRRPMASRRPAWPCAGDAIEATSRSHRGAARRRLARPAAALFSLKDRAFSSR